eukprot:gb/GECH01014172.1/.p1 GENE.gb/GECH01014172.1/~~gb/GECH01014172.1/.p1  ORF type:complete len:494 (+),score=90.29 gb/GECH01014172.1/:1-1482(+)
MSETSSTITNWSGINVLAKESHVICPKSGAEVQEIFRKPNVNIRMIGSGLSFEPIVRVKEQGFQNKHNNTNVILLSMKNLTGVVDMSDDTITVRAGTTLEYVFQYLYERNRMLPCSPGVIGIQTAAGAIATGTHGQGLYQSSISDTVESLDVVLPNGDRQTFHKDHPLFGAFLTSLGCLGAVVNVTFRHTPTRVFTCWKSTITFEEFKHNFIKMNKNNELCKAWWFPETNKVHIWKSCEASEDLKSIWEENERKLTDVTAADDSMNQTIDRYSGMMAQDTKDHTGNGRQFETVSRFKNATSVIGTMNQIWCKGIPVPQINCEIAIPLDRFEDTLDALSEWLVDNSHRLHYPFIFRCTGASQAWLSPAHGKPVCYIGFLVYLAADGTAKEGSMEMMHSLQEVLAPLGGTPHLGKHFVPEIYRMPSIFTRWEQFKHLRATLDPTGKLENNFLNRILGSVKDVQTSSQTAPVAACSEEPANTQTATLRPNIKVGNN